ncbi:MAG: ABC transporter ATP-binding protein, partial [Ignavibacteria bacterium]|nr:ABC transporter ATP-binding protein [Ignavibacteria bacterium]
MIKLENVTKKYVMGDTIVMALNGIDIHIDEGEFVAIVGPSGSGKSTLMNIIGCLDIVSSGYYELNQIPIQNYDKDELADIRNQQIGFVFQQFNLLNNFSALENVMMPMTYAKVSKKDREERAHKLMSLVGLSDRTEHKPTELSGGQQQR